MTLTDTDDTYRIRPATMADSPAIRQIRNAAVRESLAIWTSVEQDPAQAEAWLAPMVQRGTALVAHPEGKAQEIVGFAVASAWHSYEGYARTVEDSIYLTSAVQGRGLGARLLAGLIESSQQAGDRTMIALIEAGNTASVRLHERYGFNTVGTIPQAGEKLGRILDLTLMSRSLKGPMMRNDPSTAGSSRFRLVSAAESVELQPEEPAVAQWQASRIADLVAHLLDLVGSPEGRPAIIAVDGRGGSGKTTLTKALTAAVPGSQTFHMDDLIWNEPLYQWDQRLVDALRELRENGSLDLVPDAWREHGREGSIRIPAGAPLVVVEGTGAGLSAVSGLIDAHAWVQTGDDVAERRGISRDIAEGVNGNAEETVRFWHWWMAGERLFFAKDRPWERADVIVSGDAPAGVEPGEVAWIPGPLLPHD
ncbi:GNAT family N-acetyltransferase [Actinomyces viscosus]|uniref:N-acyltransferase YncA n=1 Tax=Actinomyces viscosus TaxID=1656 RepID=A0A448PJ48_ACTVI|nr:GNAT family N-acetyltransferase [Actinomyces viscosus]TFH53928.1 GNAT family N-acetyltransferase [Actinomyces viscosus]VEI14928.1 N-acyltransferase YncA [Actinomyces viscosus]